MLDWTETLHFSVVVKINFFICTSVGLNACICMACVQYLSMPEEGNESPGTGATDGYQLPCGCWELNMDPLQKEQVLLTTEPSLCFASCI